MRFLRLIFPAGCSLVLLGLLLLPGCSPPRETASDVNAPRVVSLAPSLTEIICAVGAETQLVGRTTACDYPPDKIAAIPVVGGFGAPALDLLLKIEPTLVLDVDLADAALGDAIDQVGLTRKRIACSTVDDIPRAILQVGRLTSQDNTAHALAKSIRTRIAELRAEVRRRQASDRTPPLVFIEIWSDPLTTVGKKSFLSDLVSLAGGRNLGDEVADRAYVSVSAEWIIARNPEIIICLYMNKSGKAEIQKAKVSGQISNPQSSATWDKSATCPASGGATNQQVTATWSQVAARTGWAGIAAVKNHRVYGNLNNSAILRPGPRVLEGIEDLRRCIE